MLIGRELGYTIDSARRILMYTRNPSRGEREQGVHRVETFRKREREDELILVILTSRPFDLKFRA